MKVKGLMAQNQFNFVFQLLVRAFAIPGNPTILVIDDLQWADKASLDLLRALVIGSKTNPILVIECYRENEISDVHPLSAHLQYMKGWKIPLTEIQVGNLTKDEVNTLLSDVMNESFPRSKSLSNVVYRKTCGNALLVKQLIMTLWNEGLLVFSFHDRIWRWNIKLIESKGIPDDAAGLMAKKILCLSSDVQMVLMGMA
eukprot:4323712-Ditylum_brightwellii.AAC.1